MPERSNGSVLKTDDGANSSVGSNPTPAAQPGGFWLNGAGLRPLPLPTAASVFVREDPPFSDRTGERTGERDTSKIDRVAVTVERDWPLSAFK